MVAHIALWPGGSTKKKKCIALWRHKKLSCSVAPHKNLAALWQHKTTLLPYGGTIKPSHLATLKKTFVQMAKRKKNPNDKLHRPMQSTPPPPAPLRDPLAVRLSGMGAP